MSYLPPQSYPIVSKSGDYTLTGADGIVQGDTSSAAITFTLLTAVGISGKSFILKNIGSKVLTIATTSAQTIDGATTYKINQKYSSITVISDGANWIII